MKTRHAQQIRTGILAAKYADKQSRPWEEVRALLLPLERKAFDKYERNGRMRWIRARLRECEKEQRQRAAEYRIAAEEAAIAAKFVHIIKSNWGKR